MWLPKINNIKAVSLKTELKLWHRDTCKECLVKDNENSSIILIKLVH